MRHPLFLTALLIGAIPLAQAQQALSPVAAPAPAQAFSCQVVGADGTKTLITPCAVNYGNGHIGAAVATGFFTFGLAHTDPYFDCNLPGTSAEVSVVAPTRVEVAGYSPRQVVGAPPQVVRLSTKGDHRYFQGTASELKSHYTKHLPAKPEQAPDGTWGFTLPTLEPGHYAVVSAGGTQAWDFDVK